MYSTRYDRRKESQMKYKLPRYKITQRINELVERLSVVSYDGFHMSISNILDEVEDVQSMLADLNNEIEETP